MNGIDGLARLFLDPLGLAVGAVVVASTVAILRRMYERVDSVGELLAELATAYGNSEYEATAGGRLPDYVDVDRILMAKPELLGKVAGWVVTILERYPTAKVCFVEKDSGPVGALTMQSLVAANLGRPTSTIRVRRDIRRMALKGAPIMAGDDVVLVQDVMRTGFQVVQAAHILKRDFGARTIAAIALVDREEPKDREFVESGITLISAGSRSNLRNWVESSRQERQQMH